MVFEYNDISLSVIKNPDNVMMIKTMRDKSGSYLAAWLGNGDVLQLTKSKSFLTYPFEPLRVLTEQIGESYWQNFAWIDETVAINKKYLEDFKYCDHFKERNRYKLFVYFKNNDHCHLASPQKKYFKTKMLPELKEKFDVEIKEIDNGFTID